MEVYPVLFWMQFQKVHHCMVFLYTPGQVYIGQTGRTVVERVREEHQLYIKLKIGKVCLRRALHYAQSHDKVEDTQVMIHISCF